MDLELRALEKVLEAARHVEQAKAIMREIAGPAQPPAPAAPAADNPHGVERYAYDGMNIQTYSSWCFLWGGVIGAGHSDEGFESVAHKPPFASGAEVLRPGGLDAVLYGCTLPDEPPPQLRENDRIRIYGFPAGSKHIETRDGRVLMKRPGGLSWITVFDDGQELVVPGMSGGLVVVVQPDGSERPAAILVVQNSRTDVDQDGDQENGADVVSLRDVWDAINGAPAANGTVSAVHADTPFDRAVAAVIEHEGGFQKNRNDRGNWDSGIIGVGKLIGTNYGLSAMTYGEEIDIPTATPDDARRIYKRDFWDPLGADDLPEGVAFLLFDFAVNAGQSTAVRALQKAAEVEADGVLGPNTRKAVAEADAHELMFTFTCNRLAHYRHAAGHKDFGDGWRRRALKAYDQARALIKEAA